MVRGALVCVILHICMVGEQKDKTPECKTNFRGSVKFVSFVICSACSKPNDLNLEIEFSRDHVIEENSFQHSYREECGSIDTKVKQTP